MIFENPDLPVNKVRAKPSNRDTENSQKVHSLQLNNKHARELKIGMQKVATILDIWP